VRGSSRPRPDRKFEFPQRKLALQSRDLPITSDDAIAALKNGGSAGTRGGDARAGVCGGPERRAFRVVSR
jgi:hypothetical protein